MSNIILYGLKSVGKTTIGKRLASALKRPFIDTDELIEKRYEETSGKSFSCREIFLRHGEKYFRELESEVLTSLYHFHGAVISLGGSSLVKRRNRKLIKKMGKLLYLHLEKWALKERLLKAPLPFISTEKEFDEYYDKRALLYEKIRDTKIDLTGESETAIIKKLLEESRGKS